MNTGLTQASRTMRSRRALVLRLIIILGMGYVLSALLPNQVRFTQTYQIGKPWQYPDLFSPFDFALLKSDETLAKERQRALADFHPIYYLRQDLSQRVKSQFATKSLKDTAFNADNFVGLVGLSIIDSLYRIGIIEQTDTSAFQRDSLISLRFDKRVDLQPRTKYLTLQQAFLIANARVSQSLPNVKANKAIEIFAEILRPNILYDTATLEKRDALISSILLTSGKVRSGELIITRGSLVNPERAQVLESLQKEYEAIGGSRAGFYVYVGKFLLLAALIAILMYFLYLFRPWIFGDASSLFVIMLNVIIAVALIHVASLRSSFSPYVVPLCSIAIITRALFDVRTAVFTHIIITLFGGFIAPNGLQFVFVQLLAGFTAVFTLVDIRRRSQFFGTSGFVFIMYAVSYTGLKLYQTHDPFEIDSTMYIWFAINSVLTLLAYPLVYIYERIFGFISDVTLMELADTNSPLLRELSIKAPGTFQHSNQVANLAEAVIYRIGGNSILTRVGALYHDIGKMTYPMYFTENQVTGTNPHDELSYEESAQIIIGHVFSGIDIAKKNGIAESIIDFIRTHHGTSRVEYFYQSQIRNFPSELINETQYQYPGPVPFSKETAIVMMADSVEASAKSLRDVSALSLNALVDQIIDKQIENGQFDNANLTFQDIAVAKSTFKRMLASIYHVRIEYPKTG